MPSASCLVREMCPGRDGQRGEGKCKISRPGLWSKRATESRGKTPSKCPRFGGDGCIRRWRMRTSLVCLRPPRRSPFLLPSRILGAAGWGQYHEHGEVERSKAIMAKGSALCSGNGCEYTCYMNHRGDGAEEMTQSAMFIRCRSWLNLLSPAR